MMAVNFLLDAFFGFISKMKIPTILAIAAFNFGEDVLGVCTYTYNLLVLCSLIKLGGIKREFDLFSHLS